mgnify:FL=1|tara:strand:- start:177 stop:404 length:228 start_codon:yes stop_codon:yes gene_type:complete
MKNKTEEKRNLNVLTPTMLERLNMFESKIKELKEKKHITEETLKELDNLISELLIMRAAFTDNLINWTKQGYLIE